MSRRSQTASFVPECEAIYCASHIDVATTLCCFERHQMALSKRKDEPSVGIFIQTLNLQETIYKVIMLLLTLL